MTTIGYIGFHINSLWVYIRSV